MTAGGDDWGGYVEEPEEEHDDARPGATPDETTVVGPDRHADDTTAPSPAAPADDPTVVRPATPPEDTVVLPPARPPDEPTVVGPGRWGDGATLIHYPPPPPLATAPESGGSSWSRGPWRFLIAFVGIAAIAAGVILIVSHSKGRSTSTITLLGRTEFIRRADAICRQLTPEIQADYEIALADGNAGNIAGAQSEVRRLETAAVLMIDQIAALGPPAQGAAAVTTLLGEYRQLVGDAVADTPESNAAADALQTQIAALAAQFGFHVCGRT